MTGGAWESSFPSSSKRRKFSRTIRSLPSPQRGFNIFELLVVLAIVGILLAIAYPMYQNSMIKVGYAEARNALLRVEMAREVFSSKYAKGQFYDIIPSCHSPTDTESSCSKNYESDTGLYDITVTATYKGSNIKSISAIAIPDSHKISAQSICGTFRINAEKQRSVTSSQTSNEEEIKQVCQWYN